MVEETITKDEVIVMAALAGLTGAGLLALSLSGSTGGGGSASFSHIPGMSAPYFANPPTGTIQVTTPQGVSQLLMKLTPVVDYVGPPRSVFTYARVTQNGTPVAGSGVAGVAIGFDNPASSKQYPLVPGNELQPDGSHGPFLWVYSWPGPPGENGSPTVPGGICGVHPSKGPALLTLEVYLRSGTAQGDQPGSGNAADGDGFTSPTCNRRTLYAQSQSFPVMFT